MISVRLNEFTCITLPITTSFLKICDVLCMGEDKEKTAWNDDITMMPFLEEY